MTSPRVPLTRSVRRTQRATVALIVCAVALVGWTLYLSTTIGSDVYVVHHWTLAWVGLDVVEIVGLLTTAYFLKRRTIALIPVSAATGVLFFVDAWFDTVTSSQEIDYVIALILAYFAEISLGAYCFTLTYKAMRWFTPVGAKSMQHNERPDGNAN